MNLNTHFDLCRKSLESLRKEFAPTKTVTEDDVTGGAFLGLCLGGDGMIRSDDESQTPGRLNLDLGNLTEEQVRYILSYVKNTTSTH